MDIDNTVNKNILKKLKELYPHMLNSEGYLELESSFGEETLDGHLLYLWERGMIDSEMEYVYQNIHAPARGEGSWLVKAHFTRINCNGLDYLRDNPL